MAFTSGFFNSLRGDRKYNAEQMSEIFDGILADGIIPTQGQIFAVNTAENGMQITVGTGRAWFDHTWSKNDSVMVLTVEDSDVSRGRYDTVVIEVNHNVEVRANSIKIIKGIASQNPEHPMLLNTNEIKQYPLAHIYVGPGVEEIKASNIENMVGRSPTVFATGILETAPLDDLWNQWKGEWEEWFARIKLQLSGDIVTNLQYQIDQLREYLHTRILSDQTKFLYGLDETATPDDIFLILRLETGYYAYRFFVYLSTGEACEGATISGGGLETLSGMTQTKTDVNGHLLLRSKSTNISSCTITPPYIDQKVKTMSIQSTGLITTINITLEHNTDMQTITSSTSSKVSKATTYILATAIGGGGGGGCGIYGGSSRGAGGGGGGYVDTKTINVPAKATAIQIQVGSGGSGGIHDASASTSALQHPKGSSGGTSRITIEGVDQLLAAGGGGGSVCLGDSGTGVTDSCSGGVGNGNGGSGGTQTYATAGRNGSGYIFNDSAYGLAGGGGGGGGSHSETALSGGSPYGGRGASYEYGNGYAQSGRGYGGGGGGGNGYNGSTGGVGGTRWDCRNGASGSRGCVWIKCT